MYKVNFIPIIQYAIHLQYENTTHISMTEPYLSVLNAEALALPLQDGKG